MNRPELKAWLRERLSRDSRAEGDWRRLFAGAWDQLLLTPMSVLVDESRVEAALDATYAPEQLRELVRPVVAEVLRASLEEAQADRAPVGRFVDEATREKLHALLSQPRLIQPEWVRAIFRGAAAEAVLNDTLYRALRDFSTLMPRLFLKLSPVGRLGKIGGAGLLAGRIVEELEKLVEPEIKSFLTGGTQKMLDRAADFAVQHLDDPSSLEFRRDLADFVLSRAPAFHVEPITPERLEAFLDVAEGITRGIAERAELREEVRALVRRQLDAWGEKPLGEVLEALGATGRPPLEAWADALWPTVRVFLEGPELSAWLDGLVDELLDRHTPEPRP